MPRSSAKQLRIGGRWADEIAPWGDLQWETRWGASGGGLHEISWSMSTNYQFRVPQLHGGALVELFDGPARLGAGTLDEPDIVAGDFTARGLYRRGEDFLCLTNDGVGTSILDTAIDVAIARGLEWTRPASISGDPYTGEGPTDGINYLNTLLDAVALEQSKRWFVDSSGAVRAAADPTTPAWYLAPDVADPGQVQDGFASVLVGRYQSGTDLETAISASATAVAAYGRHEEPVDLTELGDISPARAAAILNNLLVDKARPAFSERLEVTADQLTTAGGVPADLSMVQAGHLVRIQGIYDEVLEGRNYLDFVIGETQYADQSDSIAIAPMGKAPRTLRDVIAAMGQRRRFKA